MPSHLRPASWSVTTVQAGADIDDDPELRSETSMLERLEIRIHAVAATDKPMMPSMADNATLQVIEESRSDEDVDSTNGDNWNEGVDDVDNGKGEDAADGIQKHSEFLVDGGGETNSLGECLISGNPPLYGRTLHPGIECTSIFHSPHPTAYLPAPLKTLDLRRRD